MEDNVQTFGASAPARSRAVLHVKPVAPVAPGTQASCCTWPAVAPVCACATPRCVSCDDADLMVAKDGVCREPCPAEVSLASGRIGLSGAVGSATLKPPHGYLMASASPSPRRYPDIFLVCPPGKCSDISSPTQVCPRPATSGLLRVRL